MFKIMFIFFVFIMLYLIITEGFKVYKKKKAEDDLVAQQTEADVIGIREQTIKLEKENLKRKETLYKEEETLEEN